MSRLSKIRGFEAISFPQWLYDKWNLSIEQLKSVVDKKDIYESYDAIRLPQRATLNSAGYDIFSPIEFELHPHEDIKIPLGFKIYMLEDEVFKIYSRSGTGFKYIRLANGTGLIDADYYNNTDNEGHCWLKIRNESEDFVLRVDKNDAVVQGTFEKVLLADNDQPKSQIRVGGLGSTSKK